MAIDITVPERGAQPRDLVLDVVHDTFEAFMRLTDPAAQIPQLQPSIDLARAAQARDDLFDLDRRLRDICVAAAATRVKLRAVAAPNTFDEGSRRS